MIEYLKNILVMVKQSKGVKSVAKNTLWLFFDKIFKGTIGLAVGALFARYLGPERYGALSYAISFVSLVYVLGKLGLDNIVIREIIQDDKRQDALLGTAFNLNLIGGFIVFLVSVALIYLMKPHDDLIVTLVIIISLGYIFQAFNVIDLWFQSQLKSKYAAISSNIVVFIFFLAKVMLVILHASLVTLALVITLELLFSGIGLWITYKLLGFTLKTWKFSAKIALVLFKDSWPLILSGLAIMVYMRIDQIMIGNITGEKELGIYSVAVTISEIWYFIPMAIFSSVYPKIIEFRQRSQYLYFKRLQQLFNFMVHLGYSVAIFFMFFSKPIISIVFGQEYLQAASILSIHIWTGVFIGLGVASEQFLLAENFTKISFYRAGTGAVFNIILNLILIPKYGGIGAAIATLIAQFMAGYFFDLFNSHTRKTFFMKTRSLFFMPGYTRFTKSLERL